MKNFLYLYFGGNAPTTPAEGQALMDNWMAYIGKMGDRFVDVGAPLGPRGTLTGSAAGQSVGYSIVRAASLEDAIAWTDGHPHRAAGGSVEVYEAMPIPGG